MSQNEDNNTTNDTSADTPANKGSSEMSPAVQSAVKEAVAAGCAGEANQCNGTVSYIHVYQHSADCTSPEHAAAHAPKDNEVDIEIPSMGSIFGNLGGVFGKVKSAIPNNGDSNGKETDAQEGENDNDEIDSEDSQSTGWDDVVSEPPPERKVWHGLSGIAVLTFGVLAPLMISLMGIVGCPKRITLVLLNHPFETIVEIALLLLIPAINLKVWSSICKKDIRFSLPKGIALGSAIITALVICGLSFAAIPAGFNELQQHAGTSFATGFFFIGILSAVSALTGIFLMNKVRLNREFSSTRTRVVVYTAVGLVCGLLALTACEVRSWTVRVAEKMAMSAKSEDRIKGLNMLRTMNTEKELRMDCSDARAAGVAGLFIPVKRSQLQELYFNVTGKVFQDENSQDFESMPDWYLKRHVVGAPVKGLSLVRSAFNGKVSPDSLTSTINWTFVFKNDTPVEQEARAEIALPPEAVISGLTVWKDGEPVNAGFFAASNENNSNWINGGSDTPAIIRDLGKGRHLFHCYPVTQDEQLKVSIKVVVPLRLQTLDKTNLILPRFLAANFALDGENSLTIESSNKLASRSKNITVSKGGNGNYTLTGSLKKTQLDHTPLVVTAFREASMKPLAAPDIINAWIDREDKRKEDARKKAEEDARRRYEAANRPEEPKVVVTIDGSRGVREQIEGLKSLLHKKEKKKATKKKEEKLKPKWIVRTIKEVVTESPKQLIIVVDGSKELADHKNEIINSLKAIPPSMNVYLSIASNEDNNIPKPVKLSEGLKQFEKVKFAGGQDNLKTVVNAAEKASATDGGAVLWIHGPQPALSQDIYIVSPFGFRPAFFELSLDDGVTDTVEYFKNHGEVGPFMPIQKTTDVTSDLTEFFNTWFTGRKTYKVCYEMTDKKPHVAMVQSERSQREMRTVHARELVYKKIKENKANRASLLAVAYRLVSPVSCASMIKQSGQGMLDFYESSNIESAITQGAAPVLQGATNGTIGPQGGDATAIMGVNTAGTVRVNNLANLEALLNIITNLAEIAGLLSGAIIILHGLINRSEIISVLGMRTRISPATRIVIGVMLVVFALMTPGLVNWLVASARDANMFA